MRSISLIHTVKSVAISFDEILKNGLSEEVKVNNLWDDFLANNPNEIGEFTVENRNRLFYDIKAAEMTGADVIVTTCSTLTPIVDMIRPFVKTPLIAIDDAMAKKSITYGARILVMATADSTVEPTKNKLMKEAADAGLSLTIDDLVMMDAFKAMKAMEMDKHDAILRERAKEVKGYDCIILAQASMAHMDKEIEAITGCPTLSSPALCIAQVDETLKKLK